jgi:Holliday junction resolvasome RuvABC endonuclease subunit
MSGAWYIGIDPSSQLVGLAAFDEDDTLVTKLLDPRDGMTPADRRTPARRRVWLCDQVTRWLLDFYDDGVWCCVLEQPTTRFSASTLMMAAGAIGMTAQKAMPDVIVHELVPKVIDPLAGVVRTTDRKKALRARAFSLGYTGDSQDIADAVVCAYTARCMAERAGYGPDREAA